MGFTYKNIHSSTMGVVSSIASNPVLPAQKTVTYSPQYMDGTLDYTDINGRPFYEDKIIQLSLKIKAPSFSELIQKCSNVANWLQGSGDLQLDNYPDRTYKAKVQASIDFVPQILGHYAELSVQFRVPPFAEAGYQQYQQDISAGQSVNITINNNGFYSPPTITLNGEGMGTFTCNGLEYTGSLDGVTIDNGIKEIYRNGTAVTENSNLKFFEIPPGTTVLTASCTADVNVKIMFNVRVF